MRSAIAGFLTTVLLTTALATAVSAQGFQGVFSKDGTDVWAVGDGGLVHRSFDGGANWTNTNLGTKPLHGVAAVGLVVIVIGDDGEVRRSIDNGGSFTLSTLAGTPHLRSVEMVDATTGWIVGDGGSIFKTTDGGQIWTPQTSGTSQRLNAVRFRDTSNGWAVGAAGTVLHTTDGSTWAPVTVGTTKLLRAVDYFGTTVWVVGDDATAISSPDGSAWTIRNLKIDGSSNVTGVWLDSATQVVLTGGGGFLRKSLDGGATWGFQKNPVLAETSDFYYTNGGTKGWASHTKTKAVIRTTNSGATWTYTGSESRAWSLKQSTVAGTIRGNTLCMNGQNKNSIYVVLGIRVYKSLDRGETWAQIATISGGGSKTNAFYVSPTDSMDMVAAVGTPDRISRSTNGGSTWTTTKTADFTEYGVPLEMNQDKPDDLYFGPEDGKLWLSSDFGATWSELSDPGFRSPCDIQVVQDNNNVIWVGDGVTSSGQGQMFRSTDGGLSFSLIYTGSGSEIPMISGTHLNPSYGLATHWSSGGVRRTTNMGASWTQVHTAGSAWGTDFAKDDPNVCIFGVYSGGTSYHSLDGGANGSFVTTSLGGTNYAFYAPDRALLLAMQAAGVYRLNFTYTVPTSNAQSVALSSPNGGEVWTAGETRSINWVASNLGLARLEYRPNNAASWQQVADLEGYSGTYSWLVPQDATTQAEVRVSDAWDSSPTDVSNSTFTILAATMAANPPSLDFGAHDIGSSPDDSVAVSNGGTATLNATVAVTGDGFTLASASNFTVPPGGTRYVRITFQPVAETGYVGNCHIAGNAPGPIDVALAGSGTSTAALAVVTPNGGEVWQFGRSEKIDWSSAVVQNLKIEYQTQDPGPWTLIADNVPASPNQYSWIIPNNPSTTAKVRLSQVGGGLVDATNGVFSLVTPFFAANDDTVDVGSVNIGSTGTRTIYITNPGTAPLTITSIVSNNPAFHPGRSGIIIPASMVDTTDAYFTPGTSGDDIATFTITADDPSSPHTIVVLGTGNVPSDAGSTPVTYGMSQDGSNPFRNSTTIRYRLPEQAPVSLEVFDLQGRRVARLVNAVQNAGEYTVRFGAGAVTPAGDHIGRLAAGVYFAHLQAGNFSKTYKMVLAR